MEQMTCPDIFTAAEAATYLRFPNVRAFQRAARKHDVRGVRGGSTGNEWFFAREQLELLRLAIFGLEKNYPRRK